MATDCNDSSTETPKKRMKTEHPTLEISPSPATLLCKGKSALEFETNSCGICFFEAAQDGNNSVVVSRGCIDCCDHFFCFVCIMEWAKIESKCPLCKRRFSTIRRPAKPPVFPSDRLIHVPVRDQEYNDFGNATIGSFDPYAEAKCSVCESSVDESLLLLCDLCDSAAHTYCAGLGATVPEGDWFCHDCTLLRDEREKGEAVTKSEDQSESSDGDTSPSEKDHISVFDIVREPFYIVLERYAAAQRLVSRARKDDTCLEDGASVSDSRGHELTMQNATKLGARTLGQCRNVHERIRALRDNWDSIQCGSLSFSSRKGNHGHTVDSNPETCVDSGQFSSTSCSHQNANPFNGSPSISQNRGPYEIDKAWKMMDVAKSIEKRRCTWSRASKNLSSKHLFPNSHHNGSNKLPGIRLGKNSGCHSYRKAQQTVKSGMFERLNLSDRGHENGGSGFVIPTSLFNCQFMSHNVQHTVQHDIRNANCQGLPEKTSLQPPSSASRNCGSSTRMNSSFESATAPSNLCHAKSFLERREPSTGKGVREERPVNPDALRNYDAKSQIQNLVKLNLKLLTKDRKLEVSAFKEVARLSTHSILAACGLEHPRTGIHTFSSFECRHEKAGQQFQRSTLMPSSCRECFYVFVKDVVDTIMVDRIGYQKVL